MAWRREWGRTVAGVESVSPRECRTAWAVVPIIAHDHRFDPGAAGAPRRRRDIVCRPAAHARHPGQFAAAGLSGNDPDPGGQPAAGAAGARFDRPGQDRQRQDGGLCAGAAGPAECAPLCGAGAGAVPHARAGRAGGRRGAAPGAGRGQHQGGHPVRRQSAARPGGEPGARRPHRRWHAGARARSPVSRDPEPRRTQHPGAGRGRPHAGHGLSRRHGQGHAPVPEGSADAAVLGHLPRGHRAAGAAVHARRTDREGGCAACQPAHPRAVLRGSARRAPARRGPAAGAFPAREHAGLLQHAPAVPRPGGAAAGAGLRCAGAARRAGAARARPGAGAVCQPQLLGAGGHRRGGARAGHHAAGRGDQRGHQPRPRGACAPHRSHRARGRGRPGAQPGGHG